MKPRLLDLFCGAGGAAMGYHRAGFEVVGVDIKPQPHYPFEFVQMDALQFMESARHSFPYEFAAFHASPPCQAFSLAQRLQKNDHPKLIEPIRALLRAAQLPYVIENVVGAPLLNPVLVCGAAFPELAVYRHRLFESNVPLPLFPHLGHGIKLTKLGHRSVDGEFMHVVGHFNGVDRARRAMAIDWPMTQHELAEAIPPAYTEWIGRQLLAAIGELAA